MASKKAVAGRTAVGRTQAARRRAAAAGVADWTVMVYMAGDNSLDEFGLLDVAEMKKVGSSDRINILVQRDTAAAGMPTVRYRLRRGTPLAADAVDPDGLGETNTGDPRVFSRFLDWGLETCPAKRTMVVLWNHGAGWDDTDVYHEARRRMAAPPATGRRRDAPAGRGARPGVDRAPAGFMRRGGARRRHRGPFFLSDDAYVRDGRRRAIAFDDEAQDFLDNVEMKEVLDAAARRAGQPFEVIGMDACLMAMVETGVQVAAAGRVLCGSQEIEPGAGWPYDTVLRALARTPEMTGLDLATLVTERFVASYPKTEKATQSAIDLARIRDVADAADALGRRLAAALAGRDGLAVRGAVSVARTRAQSYEATDYVDLVDFAERLARSWGGANAEVAAVRDAVKRAVVANHAPHRDVARSHGLSIHFPTTGLSPLYARLAFGRGDWARFLARWTS